MSSRASGCAGCTASRRAGYRPLWFGEEEGCSGPYVLWRHDVDLDLAAVLPVARIEAEEGVRATYFLMLRSRFYNLLSAQGAEVVHRLAELGHAVGLHCDLQTPRDAVLSADEIQVRVRQDWTILQAEFSGKLSRVVSFHNPPRSVLGVPLNDFYSTYQPKFFGPIKYLSDSLRRCAKGRRSSGSTPAATRGFRSSCIPSSGPAPGRRSAKGCSASSIRSARPPGPD